jgi:peptidoglycan/LPS O-acetylase OafA/YrhL
VHFVLIDYYRYAAALIVAISHYFISYYPSPELEFIAILGVELFFPLSGFVLASQLQKLQSHRKGFKTFFFRRWLRTIPPYLVALTCAAMIFETGSFFNFLKFLSYTQNIYSDNSSPNFYSVAWSLSVEEWFYITIPLCLFIMFSLTPRIQNKLQTLCLIIIVIGLCLKLIFMPSPDLWGEEIRRSVLFRIDSLCYGVLTFMWRKKITSNMFFVSLFIISISIFYLLNSIFLISNNSFVQFIFLPSCSLLFSLILAYLSKFEISAPFSKVGKFLANISYSMYLFHIIFIALFQNLGTLNGFGFVFYFAVVTAFSTIFYYFFEKPINDSRPKYQ